ncbi:MAG: histidine kinase [Rubrivivax sp.]|jgi:two-component system sensor histidine kinase UhpB|nr:histidine kinase [Rubrivivax sp.]
MSLRLKLQILVGGLTLAFVVALLGLQVRNMRDSVTEEVVAANRVAAQLLNRLAWVYASQGTPAMLEFLQGVGRVRSNEIELLDAAGKRLYASPPSPYKAGRDAPLWFERMISPEATQQVYEFPDGRLVVRSNASRAALDGWDAFVVFAGASLVLLVVVNAALFWAVGRATRPFGQIVDALGALEAGRFDVELPPLPGREAGAIGAAFNRMVQGVRERIETERQLVSSRELTRWIDRHVEEERRQIARELHDEFGQSVTAIRSLALSVARRAEGRDADAAQAARVIADESSRLYDAMHGLIPRLTPLVIDSFGLPAALDELAERMRRAHPGLTLRLRCRLGDTALPPECALALYRAAQEGITNALRHGGASSLALDVGRSVDAPREVNLVLVDDGSGLAEGWQQGGSHHGLRWLRERVAGLGGTLEVGPAHAASPGDGAGRRGVRLAVRVPVDHSPAIPRATA